MTMKRRDVITAGAAAAVLVATGAHASSPKISLIPCARDFVPVYEFLERVAERQAPPGWPQNEPHLLPTIARLNRMVFEAQPETLLFALTMDDPVQLVRGEVVTARTRMFQTVWEIDAWNGLESRPFASWSPSDVELEPVARSLADEIVSAWKRLPPGHEPVAYIPVASSGTIFIGRGTDTRWSMHFLTRFGVTPDIERLKV